MDASRIKIKNEATGFHLLVDGKPVAFSPFGIETVAPNSNNYRIYDDNQSFQIYNVKRGNYVGKNRHFRSISSYSEMTGSFAAKTDLNTSEGVFSPFMLILDNGDYLGGKDSPRFLSEVCDEVSGYRAVQIFSINPNQRGWVYLYIDTEKVVPLWNMSKAQKLPLGDIVSSRIRGMHVFYYTTAHKRFLNIEQPNGMRKFLYFKEGNTLKCDFRASFNSFKVCEMAPLYFVGEQKCNETLRFRLFRFNFTDYSKYDRKSNHELEPSKQMALPITDLEYYDEIKCVGGTDAARDVFVVSQNGRWLLLKFDEGNKEFVRPLKSHTYPSSASFIWRDGLLLALRDEGYYDIYDTKAGDSFYSCLSLLWHKVSYDPECQRIDYIDLNDQHHSVQISEIMVMYDKSIQSAVDRLINQADSMDSQSKSMSYHIDYCTYGDATYLPENGTLRCDKRIEKTYIGKIFCIIDKKSKNMYICERKKFTFEVIDAVGEIASESLNDLSPNCRYIKVDKFIPREDLPKIIVEMLPLKKSVEEMQFDKIDADAGDLAQDVGQSFDTQTQINVDIVNPSINKDMYKAITYTVDLWKSYVATDTVMDMIRPIVQRHFREIKITNKEQSALLESYALLMEPSEILLDETILSELKSVFPTEIIKGLSLAIEYHKTIHALTFEQAFKKAVEDIDKNTPENVGFRSKINSVLAKIDNETKIANKTKGKKIEDQILMHFVLNGIEMEKVSDDTVQEENTTEKSEISALEDDINTDIIEIQIDDVTHHVCLNSEFPKTINDYVRRVVSKGNTLMYFVDPNEVETPEKKDDFTYYRIKGVGKNEKDNQHFGHSNENTRIKNSGQKDIFLFLIQGQDKYTLHDVVRYIDHEEVEEGNRSVIYFILESRLRHKQKD